MTQDFSPMIGTDPEVREELEKYFTEGRTEEFLSRLRGLHFFQDFLNKWLDYGAEAEPEGKCSESSRQHFQSAQQALSSKDYKVALDNINLAILTLPNDESLWERYRLRLDVLAEAQNESFFEINDVLAEVGRLLAGHPLQSSEDYQFLTKASKLEIKLLVEKKELDLAEKSFSNFLRQTNLIGSDLEATVMDMYRMLKSGPPEDEAIMKKSEKQKGQQRKFQIKHFKTDGGRKWIAESEIPPSEVLCSELPLFVSYNGICDLNKKTWHCLVCYKDLILPIPCRTCSEVAYCHEHYQEASNYHSIACRYMGILKEISALGAEMQACLVLQIIAMKPCSFFLENWTSFQKAFASNSHVPSAQVKNEFARYKHLFNLTGNIGACFPPALHSALITFLIRKILQATNYLKNMDEEEYLDARMTLIIYQTCNIVKLNAVPSSRNLARQPALAIYPTFAFLNHSCVPNAFEVFDKDGRVHVISSQIISKGSEICRSYCNARFDKHKKEDRQGLLTGQYGFTCVCLACKNDWSNGNRDLVKCPKCSHPFPLHRSVKKCNSCKHHIRIKQIMQKFEDLVENIEISENDIYEEDTAIGLARVKKSQEVASHILAQQNNMIFDIQDLAKRLMDTNFP